MTNQTNLMPYYDMLQELETFQGQKNLLLGNGFNLSLKIYTDYKTVFNKMIEETPEYEHVTSLTGESHDVEKLIAALKDKMSALGVHKDDALKDFLPSFVEDKITFDFMKTIYGIVRSDIGKAYRRTNQGVYRLLQQFDNYFTMNYDPLLYLLLMRYKAARDKDSQKNPFSKEENPQEWEVYEAIKRARKGGSFSILVDGELINEDLRKSTKEEFVPLVKKYFRSSEQFKDKKFKSKPIGNVCSRILEEEKDQTTLTTNDGFQAYMGQKTPIYKGSPSQNLFFLHGAFHIYKENGFIKKITQTRDKTLYEHLEKIVPSNEREMVYVLRGEREEKERDIRKIPYLLDCHNTINQLTGCLVILGSSLGDNDGHIFDAIKQSKVSDIYISTSEDENKKDFIRNKAEGLFPSRKIVLFNYKTISYKISRSKKNLKEAL